MNAPGPNGLKSCSDDGHIAIVTGITRLRETEEALKLSKIAAEAAHAAKSRFLAAMNAELRTPLITILAETAAIASNKPPARARQQDPAELSRSCATIDSAARSLLGMIDTILDLTRLEAGRFDLTDQPIDLAPLLRSIVRRFDPMAAAAEVTLVVDLPVSLPTIRADEHRLRQVVSDVVANALAGTGRSGSVSIRACNDWATGGFVLQVQNTGTGQGPSGQGPNLAEDDLERIFEPFDRPGAAGCFGNGLGLYVGRIVMRAHGGDLAFRSASGQGTTAMLTFPSARVMQDTGLDAN